MAWHTAGNGMDGKCHFRAIAFQQLTQLPHHVLCLSNGHTVARHKRHTLCRFQDVIGIFGSQRLHFAFYLGCLLYSAKAGEEDVREGAIHRLTHDVGQDDASSTDQRSGHNQNVVVDRKTGRTSSKPGVTVQQRDHHWHIGAANRDHHHDAQDQRQNEQQVEREQIAWVTDKPDTQQDNGTQHRCVDHSLRIKDDCRGRHALRQFAVSNQATGHRDATDKHGQRNRERSEVGVAVVGQCRPADEQTRRAA